eukprot:3252851-Rhodomonas_salina.2
METIRMSLASQPLPISSRNQPGLSRSGQAAFPEAGDPEANRAKHLSGTIPRGTEHSTCNVSHFAGSAIQHAETR